MGETLWTQWFRPDFPPNKCQKNAKNFQNIPRKTIILKILFGLE